MTDEFVIRKAARDLQHLYQGLEEAKHTSPSPPDVRTMQNTGGNPSMPGNWIWMHRGITLSQKLQQETFKVFGALGIKIKDKESGTQPLLEKIATSAFYIAELPQSAEFLEVLEGQVSQLGRWLYPPGSDVVANQDSYLTADSIQHSLTNKGLGADPATIRQWASRGHVATKARKDGRTAYRLADIINRLTSNE